ncbi:MAG TPA: alpha/beta hydrolase [Longilinea sp.]|nr:alpha/beta hydrolase [Longilinea sp.]
MIVLLWIGIGLAVVLLFAAIMPLVIPIPPMLNTRLPDQLADPDSLFTQVNGLLIHYKDSSGDKPVIVLLHGFGASLFSFNAVAHTLAKKFRVIAFDRIGFGLSQRPTVGEWKTENPYSNQSQVAILFGLLDQLGIGKATLVGHSAGGAIAIQAALQQPKRVSGLVLEDTAVFNQGHGFSGGMKFLLDTPQAVRIMPYLIRRLLTNGNTFIGKAWHAPERITEETFEFYKRPLQIDGWDRALFEFTRAERSPITDNQLITLSLPVLVISGDDDQFIPPRDSEKLAKQIPLAQLVLCKDCGHIPHEEKPEEFMNATIPFLQTLNQ